MIDLMQTSSPAIALPQPRVKIAIRPATPADIPFMDGLQKLHTKQVGWMPTAQFEGKIRLGHVLIAEEVDSRESMVDSSENASLSTINHRLSTSLPTPVGYCIGNDQYFKRDDVGIIYQMNVLPGKQRGFIGAALLKAMFERSAYGCKLYCCWCAQDIAANRFWEAMGFVPLAFRTGSRTKGKGPDGKTAPRVHIFWQKRIRQGDTTTPWWFPSQTGGGSIREDRIVLPIPPGTHWSDAKPMVLPGVALGEHTPALPVPRKQRVNAAKAEPVAKIPVGPVPICPVSKRQKITVGGLHFGPEVCETTIVKTEAVDAVIAELPIELPKPEREKIKQDRPKQSKPKNDPRLIAAARELRDRWLEQVNDAPMLGQGKYDVTRAIGEAVMIETIPTKLLAA